MAPSKETLENALTAGAVTDIFKAERAYALLRTIGLNAEAINASNKNLGELFGVLQAIAQTEALISVARLFDSPSKKYPTRCLRAMLADLEDDAETLPPIIERQHLARELARLGMDPAGIVRIKDAPGAEVTKLLVGFLRDRMEQPLIVDAVRRVKVVRDKRIAHNEAAHRIDSPTWHAVVQLLVLAKEIVGLIGWAYMNRVYMIEGEYQLSQDAERPAYAMKRLLEHLGMSEPGQRDEVDGSAKTTSQARRDSRPRAGKGGRRAVKQARAKLAKQGRRSRGKEKAATKKPSAVASDRRRSR